MLLQTAVYEISKTVHTGTVTFFIPALSFSFSHHSYCSNLAGLPVICLLSAHLPNSPPETPPPAPAPYTHMHAHIHFLLLIISFLLVSRPSLSTRSITLPISQLLTHLPAADLFYLFPPSPLFYTPKAAFCQQSIFPAPTTGTQVLLQKTK